MELTPKEAEQIREIFELFDTDGGGTMDKQELDAARFALGFDRNQKHKKSSKKNAAPAAPELITLEEFSSMMKGEKNGRGPYDGVWMVFSVICAQGAEEGESNDRSGSAKGKFNAENKVTSGYITFEGLRQACNQFNVRLSEDEVHEMMAEGDPSDSGKVDIDSFFRIIGSAPWF
jgi:Ca2+-binding EF-hand superfamily protein